MHYEIRGLLENQLENVSKMAVKYCCHRVYEPDLDMETKVHITKEFAKFYLEGFHHMWMLIGDNHELVQNDYQTEIDKMVERLDQDFAYLIDDYEQKQRQQARQQNNIPKRK